MDKLERNLSDCETLAELLPAYSIGATDAEETALVEKLLQVCPEQAAELDSYLALAEGMHYVAPPLQPPAHLHDKLMAAAGASMPKAAPVSSSVPPPAVTSVSTPAIKAVPRSRIVNFNRALAAAAGIAAALLLISNLYWVNQVNNLQQQQRDTVALMNSQQDALASLGTGKADRIQLVSTSEGNSDTVLATMLWSPQTTTALLFTDSLPTLNPDRAYQLWGIRDSQPVGVGVFQVDDQGVGVLVFNSEQPISDYEVVAITEEPASGSEQPTTTPLAAAQV